jgi:hypothetical protein
MGRPIKKKYFGNTNVGSASTTSDNFIGGEQFTTVQVLTSGTAYATATNAVIWTASTPQIVGGVAATGTVSVVAFGSNAGKITSYTVTEPGSGYSSTSSVTLTFSPATAGTTATYVIALTTSTFQNAISFYAWVPYTTGGAINSAGSSITNGDIVLQRGTRRYLVRNSQGSGICALTTGTVARSQMTITATDANGNTYWVTRLESKKAKLYPRTQNGVSAWVYTENELAKWSLDAAVGTDKTLTTTKVQIASA